MSLPFGSFPIPLSPEENSESWAVPIIKSLVLQFYTKTQGSLLLKIKTYAQVLNFELTSIKVDRIGEESSRIPLKKGVKLRALRKLLLVRTLIKLPPHTNGRHLLWDLEWLSDGASSHGYCSFSFWRNSLTELSEGSRRIGVTLGYVYFI